jgi:hypothetical protein
MKLITTHRDGTCETLELVGPLSIIRHPSGQMEIIHDAGTGADYWFDTANGYFDGAGCSIKDDDLTVEEMKALMMGLKEMREGKTRPLSDIREELSKKPN